MSVAIRFTPKAGIRCRILRILSTHAVQEVLRELGPMFERASGFSLKIDYDPANVLKRRIEGGTSFDVVIVTQPMIDELALQGKVRRGPVRSRHRGASGRSQIEHHDC
jgi:molybdate transport system substrate-binding protein